MIIGCEHHSGMGLCSMCSEQVRADARAERAQADDALRAGRSKLLAAARVLRDAQRWDLASRLEELAR